MGAFLAPMRPGTSVRGKWFTWGIRIVAFVLLIIMFAVTINAFYTANDPAEVREHKHIFWEKTKTAVYSMAK